MKKEPWVCKLWLPLPAPLGRVCYIETGWDGKGRWESGFGSPVPPPKSQVGLEETKGNGRHPSPQLFSRSSPSGKELDT